MSIETDTPTPDAHASAQDPRWNAVRARDASADGNFYYSVTTTGVYCMPSCAARPARPEHVAFHATREDAERAGFRPCKRCKPDQPDARRALPPARIMFDIEPSSLGLVLVARSATSDGLCAVLLGDDRETLRRELQDRFPGATLIEGDAALHAQAMRVVELVESPERGLDIELDLRGTEFQRMVWQALREIPAGSTATYTEIARRIGRPAAVRAVGHACGANPLAVIVPCHRAVRSDGTLAGYRWGIERKRILLEREATTCATA